jgi:hypothetical protein
MSDAQLKPCPFCGAAIDDMGDADHDGYFAKCSDKTLSVSCSSTCGVIGPKGSNRQSAIAIWNTRPTPTLADALAVPEVAALVDALSYYACNCGDMCEQLSGTCGDTARAALAQIKEVK